MFDQLRQHLELWRESRGQTSVEEQIRREHLPNLANADKPLPVCGLTRPTVVQGTDHRCILMPGHRRDDHVCKCAYNWEQD